MEAFYLSYFSVKDIAFDIYFFDFSIQNLAFNPEILWSKQKMRKSSGPSSEKQTPL